MPRIDDYVAAKALSVETLSKIDFTRLAGHTGFQAVGTDGFDVPFLDRHYRVSYPGFDFRGADDESREVPIQEQVLILHYFAASSSNIPTGHWVAYREIRDASFYFSAFVKRAIDPLKKVFGGQPGALEKPAGLLGGRALGDTGDVAFEFRLFPRVPVQLIVYAGDEEFPPEANILFDRTIGDILSAEDIAWLAGMLVYRLIALSH